VLPFLFWGYSMSGSSGGPSGGGIKGKDGMTRGGTKGGRVYVKTDRAGSDAKPKANLPTKTNPVAERGSSSPAAKSEVARSGSAGASNSSSTEVGGKPRVRVPAGRGAATLPDVGKIQSGTGVKDVNPGVKSPSRAVVSSGLGSGVGPGNRVFTTQERPGSGKATPSPAPKATTKLETPGFGSMLGRLLGRAAGPLGAAAAVMSPSETNAGEKEWLAKNKGQNASMGVTSPTPTPTEKAPAAPAPAAKKAAPAPAKKAPAPAKAAPKPVAKASGLSVDDKIGQLVAKGFSRADATKLAGAKGGKVDAPAGFAKGGMPKKAKVPGMPRMPKMPATGKEAMASKFAAMTKPKKFK
jgi:hypothetical protein